MPAPPPDVSLSRNESSDLSLAVYRFPRDLAMLKENWIKVTDSFSEKRFFHLFSWYLCYLESLENDPATVFFCVARRGTRPVAVFPLKSVKRRIGGLDLRCLEIPTHDHLNLSDFVFERIPDNAMLLRTLIKKIRRLSGETWDVIRIPNALEDSVAAYALQQGPRLMSFSAFSKRSNQVNCRMPYEKMAENFKSGFRRNLRRLHRRAQELGRLQFTSYQTVPDIQRHFHELLEVEASGWKGEKGTQTAIACEQATLRFYQKIVEQFGAAGQCWLNLLTLNDKCIAAQLCLVADGMLHILKIGFDESHAAIAPGNLLLDELFQQCTADDRVHGVSFVTGREWNFLWGAKPIPVYDHYLFNPASIRGWAAYLACRGKRFLQPLLRWNRSDKTPPRADKAAITNS